MIIGSAVRGSSGGSTTDASALTTGTLDSARLPVVPVAKGGTGADLSSSSGVPKANAGSDWEVLDAAGVRTFADVPSNADLTSEASTRASADTALDARLDTAEATLTDHETRIGDLEGAGGGTVDAASVGTAAWAGQLSGTNTYTSSTPAIASYTDGLTVRFVVANANTGASTLNLNSKGAKSLYYRGAALSGAELQTGRVYEATYHTSTDACHLRGVTLVAAADLPSTVIRDNVAINSSTAKVATAGNDLAVDVANGQYFIQRNNGGANIYFGAKGVQFGNTSQTVDGSWNQVCAASTGLVLGTPTGKTVETKVAGTTVQAISGSAVTLSQPLTMAGNNINGVLNINGTGTMKLLSAGTASYVVMAAATDTSGARNTCYGTSQATSPGQNERIAAAVALANATARTVATTAGSRTGGVRVVDATNGRQAVYDVDAGVVTKVRGHAQFVDSAFPASGEVCLRNNSGTLEIYNNSGGSLLLTDFSDLV